MRSFVLFMFWVSLVASVLHALIMSISEYPRERETPLWSDVVSFVLILGQMVWAALVLWGGNQ